jgi:hypothetical protein
MKWLFDNPQVFIVIAIAAVSLLRRLKRTNTPQPGRAVTDADASDRTRRVQEEIRRKIAERTARAPAEARAVPQPPVIARAGQKPNIFKEFARQMAEAGKIAEARARVSIEQRAQQSALAEQKARELAEAQRAAAEQSRIAGMVAMKQAGELPAVTKDAGKGLLPELRGPASLKRAIVLREILGPPVGLR